jgi:hypothetical protein
VLHYRKTCVRSNLALHGATARKLGKIRTTHGLAADPSNQFVQQNQASRRRDSQSTTSRCAAARRTPRANCRDGTCASSHRGPPAGQPLFDSDVYRCSGTPTQCARASRARRSDDQRAARTDDRQRLANEFIMVVKQTKEALWRAGVASSRHELARIAGSPSSNCWRRREII